MSPEAPAAEIIKLNKADLLDWSDKAAYLLREQPESARAEFTHLLTTAQSEEDQQTAAFALVALARVDMVQLLRAEAVKHARQAQALADAIEEPAQLAQLHRLLGEVFRDSNKSDESLTAFRVAARHYATIKDVPATAACYSEIGTLYLQRSQHDQALTALLKACQLNYALNDQAELANCYHKLAAIYFEQEMADQALAYGHKSLEAAQLSGDESRIADAYNILGVLNKQMEQYDQAVLHFTEALQLQRFLGDKKNEANIMHNMGLVYEATDELEKAMHYYAAAMALRLETNDHAGMLRSYAVLGTTHTKLRRFDLATNYFRRALQIAQESNARLMEANIYKELADVHAQLGNFERAYAYQRQFSDLRHQIFNETRVTRFAEAQTKFAAGRDKRRADIYRNRVLKLESELAQMREWADQAVVPEDVRSEKVRKAVAEKSAEYVDLHQRIIAALSQQMRVPLSIISNASQLLSRHRAEMDESKIDQNFQHLLQSVAALKEMLDEICWLDSATSGEIEVVREAISLKHIAGFALDKIAEDPQAFARIEVLLPKQKIEVEADQRLLQKILIQLLSNGLKFSAEKLQLKLGYGDENILIEVRDSGSGIDPQDRDQLFDTFYRGSNAAETSGLGLGLSITKQLVALLDGSIHIQSDGPDKGCIISVTIPAKKVA